MHLFTELSIILAIAALLAGILKALKQPLIVAYIITGLVVGRSGLNFITSHETLGVFSEFGIALLLFIIGLGLNPNVIKEVGKIAAIAGVGQIVITWFFSLAMALVLGFELTTATIIALALTFSSTIIILKTISDKKESHRLYAKIAIGILLVQDIIATLALIALSAIGSSGKGGATTMVLGTIIASSILIVATKFIVPKLSHFISSNQEFLFIFTIAWGIGFAALFDYAGLSIEIGALFAGVALSTLPYTSEIAGRLRPLRDFFVMIFFVLLGADMEIANFSSIIIPSIIFSLFVLIGNPLIIMALLGMLGYTKQTGAKTGIAIAQISEFSLVFIILAHEVGLVSSADVSTISLVGIATFAISTYMMQYDEAIYKKFERYLSIFERKSAKKLNVKPHGAEAILFGYSRGGPEIIKSFQEKQTDFVVVDYNPETIDVLDAHNIPFVYGDATDPEFLAELNLENVKIIVTTTMDFQTNLFLTMQARAINQKAIIIVHSETPSHAVKLYERGATYVTMPHYIGAERIARMINKNKLRKADFIPAREKHLRYVEKHL
ncbi:cation:proton antiporter [Candidatus Saccharibacteria bacterium]|jgi:Kef-type K+ transport system membrane component KefB|nr:cation:proton antiporter [Candidatus Saccharibacteria bacterium]